MVAKTLQEYGAFDVENAEGFNFTSEYGSKPPGSTGDPYAPLAHIKFAQYLRVRTIAPAQPARSTAWCSSTDPWRPPGPRSSTGTAPREATDQWFLAEREVSYRGMFSHPGQAG
jgi:hypothetical protein